MGKKHHIFAGALLALALAGIQGEPPSLAQTGPRAEPEASRAFSPETYLEHVAFLAAPDLEGRGNGTPELEEAAEYLAEQFRSFGLEPGGENGTYFQTFEITTDTELGSGSQLALNGVSLDPGLEFSPMRFSEVGAVEAPLVFVGYGITAPEMHWDDYRDVDVEGKIVIALRHEPQERDEDSPFDGAEFTAHAEFMNKAINAKQHGAAGILFVLDPNNHDPDEDAVRDTALRTVTDNSGIPAAYVGLEPTLAFFEAAGFDLRGIQREIDADLEPRSFELPEGRVRLRTDLVRIRKPVRNVLAALEGSDPELNREWVVVGAHYDHLGLDGEFSLARNPEGQIHHGADDNASGTAGILELARVAALNRDTLERSILFIGFAAEELGLLGSTHFVNNPTIDIENVTSMVNLDMIGRLRDDRVFVSGVGTSPGFSDLLGRAREGSGLETDLRDRERVDLRIDLSNSGMGGSDHMSFNIKRIPVLFFFSGLHSDYHRPTDTAEKINVEGATEVLRLAYRAIDELAGMPERPLYTRVEAPESGGGDAGGGYGPYFGSVPDFRDDLDGVMFADVTPGSPAAEAGLAGGDILVEFDGKPIENLYDFTYALQAQQAGNVVTVVVERDGERVTAEVTLGAR